MKKSTLTDQELVKQFLNGNQSAIEVLIQRYKSKVFTYIFLMVKNETLAEDIFQETFIKVIKSLHRGKYQDSGRFMSWVMRIAHNLVIDHFRKAQQMKTLSNDDYEMDIFNSDRFSEQTVEQELVQEQITSDVRSLVEQLPDEQREVVVLRHYLDLSFKEIAEQTGVSINTALGRMRYALINMRKMIEEKKINLKVK